MKLTNTCLNPLLKHISGATCLILFRISILSEGMEMLCVTMKIRIEKEAKTSCFSFATIIGDSSFLCVSSHVFPMAVPKSNPNCLSK